MLGRVVPHDLPPNVTDRNSIQKKTRPWIDVQRWLVTPVWTILRLHSMALKDNPTEIKLNTLKFLTYTSPENMAVSSRLQH